ncbi:hypothetical protein B0H13DRAFT_2433953 [Mycena leptocephala]|nr:hypothetical protein B0H13DRAFT_2433953 [Mycena leptocephala]
MDDICDSGIEYAIHHLDVHPHLNAPLRLVLAITYDVDKWVAIAFTSLMQIPMDKLSDNDEKLLGHQTYKLLVRTHAKIDTHRHDLASYPPTVMHGGYCVDQRSCAKAWDNAWFENAGSGMVSALLDAKLRGAALCSAMREFQVYGMPEDCRVRALASIADTPEKKSGFKKESVIVEEAIKELMGHSYQTPQELMIVDKILFFQAPHHTEVFEGYGGVTATHGSSGGGSARTWYGRNRIGNRGSVGGGVQLAMWRVCAKE